MGKESTATRHVSDWNELGMRRHDRYSLTFDRALEALADGYPIEAITLLDSLLNDRLASRLGHLSSVESWGLSTGQICRELVGPPGVGSPCGKETDDAFRAVIEKIQHWARRRTEALHQVAKILREEQIERTLAEVIEEHRQDAEEGLALLRELDLQDVSSRRPAGRTPPTYPSAFFPERRTK